MSTLAEQLHKAADIIEGQGWAQFKGNCPGEGPKCLQGALGQALGAKTVDLSDHFNSLQGDWVVYSLTALERTPAYQAVMEHIGEDTIGGPYLFTWNDADGRTAEDVIGVLRAAAVIEEARASKRTPVPVE